MRKISFLLFVFFFTSSACFSCGEKFFRESYCEYDDFPKSFVKSIPKNLSSIMNEDKQTKEVDFLNELNKYKEKIVLIPTIDLQENELLNFLYAIKKENFSQDDFDDLKEKNDLTYSKEVKEIDIIINTLTEKFETNIKNKNTLLRKLDLSKKYMGALKEKTEPYFSKIIEDQLKIPYIRINETFQKIDNLIKEQENRFFFIVFSEAFFNFNKNPLGLGNFIPFVDNSWNNIIINWSFNHPNTLLVSNMIYTDTPTSREVYQKNFEDFIKNSYKQKNILGLYDEYSNIITPIINKSFVHFKGNLLHQNQKRFILDEDIPLEKNTYNFSYLGEKKYLYIPGLEKQEKSNLFEIQICQDHVSVEPFLDSKFFILQSASINFSYYKMQTKKEKKYKYDGLCIHADIDKGVCSVMKNNIGDQDPRLLIAKDVINDSDLDFDIIRFKSYDISSEISK